MNWSLGFLLREAQWARIAPLMPGLEGTMGGARTTALRGIGIVVNAQRLPLAGLACEWSNRHTPYTRFQRWAHSGVWAWCRQPCSGRAPCARLVYSTTVRAHQQASEARKNGPQALWY